MTRTSSDPVIQAARKSIARAIECAHVGEVNAIIVDLVFDGLGFDCLSDDRIAAIRKVAERIVALFRVAEAERAENVTHAPSEAEIEAWKARCEDHLRARMPQGNLEVAQLFKDAHDLMLRAAASPPAPAPVDAAEAVPSDAVLRERYPLLQEDICATRKALHAAIREFADWPASDDLSNEQLVAELRRAAAAPAEPRASSGLIDAIRALANKWAAVVPDESLMNDNGGDCSEFGGQLAEKWCGDALLSLLAGGKS